jgi:hypothetical protein
MVSFFNCEERIIKKSALKTHLKYLIAKAKVIQTGISPFFLLNK